MTAMIPSSAGRVHVASYGRVDQPVVVLSSGLGGAWFDWDRTVRLLEPLARVIVFDRPGLGMSGPARRGPSLAREVAVLDAVLRGIPHAVLIGHSMASMHVEAYARLRPHRVNGLVLLDPDTETPGAGAPFDVSAVVAQGLRAFGSRWLGARMTRRFGHSFRNLLTAASTLGVTDPAPADLVQMVYRRPGVGRAVLAELASYPGQVATLERLRRRRELPKVPFVVLTAGRRVWPEHQSLAALVPWGRNVPVPGSRHMIQMDRPDAVVMAVREVLRGLPDR
ncbi:pimeloyl-ACP methyl ester carboxylesterase [Lentzea atacamensis]|uniref:Pimeloyl-ACP methyl ester carboxylesterase n=2 Tax=Lentzea TaxID=165301 RepID=A0A316IGG9_9PSEU|nr:alpha/beta hydrolase [Lentzea atacamensis]PWK91860.1 pimeloyl-ACP methyl ester carboxylesterase [Lentzea atacamensis]RAS59034.1 pimeloyl-ACP methyl ester carboxylesterase [Lentzea atacamensis]